MFRFNYHLGRAENKKCGQVLGGFVSMASPRREGKRTGGAAGVRVLK